MKESEAKDLVSEINKLLADDQELAPFKKWLSKKVMTCACAYRARLTSCVQGRIDVVIDGMNVGLYHTEFFNALQIEAVTELCKVSNT